MSIEFYPSVAKIKRNGVYENLPGFVPETHDVAVEQMIASGENTATAQYVHAIGSYFILNNTLYKAIANISVGDAIVVGTNCVVAVLGNDVASNRTDIDGLIDDVDDITDAVAVLEPAATSSDVGKALIAKTVSGGKVTEYEFGEAGGGGGGGSTPDIVETIENVPVASFDDGMENPIKKIAVKIDPVQSGSGDPTPENVRPITGWSGANVYRTGKNLALLDDFTTYTESGITLTKNDDGSITVNGTATVNFTRTIVSEFKVKNGTYIISGVPVNSAGNSFSIWARTGFNGSNYGRTYNGNNQTINVSNEKIYIYCTVSQGTTVDNVKIFIQLEVGTTATTFELPKRDIYSITFPTEAGTIYSGTLTINEDGSGELMVDMVKFDLSTRTWNIYTAISDNSVFYAYLPSILKPNPNNTAVPHAICDRYKAIAVPGIGVWANSDYSFGYATQPDRIIIRDTSMIGKTGSEFATAMSSVDFVAELNTPTTYQLSTQQVITLINGLNNVWADTGNIIQLQYYADSKVYIDEQDSLIKAIIAKELTSMIADTALVANDFRIVNNTLYKITTNVASGGTLTPGTNCVATTITDVIKTLLS